MLVLMRRPKEGIVIDGRILVKVLKISGSDVRLGVAAPPEVSIDREESGARKAVRAGGAAAPSTRVDRLTARLLEATEDLAAGADAAESEPEWAAIERARNGVLRAIEELRRCRKSLGGAA